jgi:chromosomal replication initiator protein
VAETFDHEADWAQQVWTLALDQLQLKMTKSAFNSWLRQSHPLSYEPGKMLVAVQNDYAKEWLENRWAGMIERVLADIIGESVRIEFTVERHLKASTG